MWKCKCDCGNATRASTASLKSGNTRSCGCYGKERRIESRKKHGKSHQRIYVIWEKMKTRCYNANDSHYKNYGGRGICVCEEWMGEHGAEIL